MTAQSNNSDEDSDSEDSKEEQDEKGGNAMTGLSMCEDPGLFSAVCFSSICEASSG